jgi:hypothetical protein
MVQSTVLATDFGENGDEDRVAGMARYTVGIDSLSSAHIVRDMELLTNLRDAEQRVEVSGIGGKVVLDRVGDFGPFGVAYYHPGAIGNVISQGRVIDDGADVNYDKYHDEYVISMEGWKWYFGRRRGAKIYTGDMSDLAAHHLNDHYVYEEIAVPAVETVGTQRRLYTARELAGIDSAKRLIATMGYPSARSLVRMVRHGKLRNCSVTAMDILNCIALHGTELARERGHRTRVPRRAIDTTRHEAEGLLVDADVSLHVDLMFVEKVPFMIGMATPMKYLFANFVSSKTPSKLKEALVKQKGRLVRQGFNLQHIYCDGESSISALAPQLELEIAPVDQAGPETHVSVVEVAIQYVKRMARGLIAALAFVKIVLPKLLIVWLIYFCASRINMLPTRTLDGLVTPREYYTGRSIDVKTDLACTFLERVEVHQKTTNTMRARTRPALALVSTGNVYGTWKCLYLDTLRVGSMDAWTPLPTDEATVRCINELSKKDRVPLTSELEFRIGDRVVELPPDSPDDLMDLYKTYGRREVLRSPGEAADYDPTEPMPQQAVEIDDGTFSYRGAREEPATAGGIVQEADEIVVQNPAGPSAGESVSTGDIVPPAPGPGPDLAANGDQVEDMVVDSDIDVDDESVYEEVELDDRGSTGANVEEAGTDGVVDRPQPEPGEHTGRVLRPRRHDWKSGPWQARVYETGLHITVRQALDRFPDAAKQAMNKEIATILGKRVTKPVPWHQVPLAHRKRMIRSSMFLKEKFLSTGAFDKLKARFVAGGNLQDRSIYTEGETSSPTVSITSAYMLMAIAAQEGRKVMTMDVGGAYLNADMQRDVYMRVDAATAAVFCELDGNYRGALQRDGSLVVKLEKALYGCIESSKLWYDNISKKLVSVGFEANTKDSCVFNKATPGGAQLTVAIYVDDLFCSCVDETQLEWLANVLTEEYKELSIHRGDMHSYLGHTLDFGSVPGKVKLTMEGYISDLLRLYNVRGTASTPATSTLFEIDGESTKLEDQLREDFHSCVAKLLYLAKRVRPDLLTAVSFLTTRVNEATEQDGEKLDRVLRYLNATPEMGMILDATKDLCVLAYVDASFAVHTDYKSRTGGVITLGKGAVWFNSSKQKLVSKSSTEAELIGLSDVLSQVIWTRDFLVSQGYDMRPAKVFQDNLSTMALAEKGGSTAQRTRHIGIRYFFVKDRIDSGEIMLEHLGTTEMIADMLTKPLQGDLFRKLRRALLNWE